MTEEQLEIAGELGFGEYYILNLPKTDYKSGNQVDLTSIQILVKDNEGYAYVLGYDDLVTNENIKMNFHNGDELSFNYYNPLFDEEYLKFETEETKEQISHYLEKNKIQEYNPNLIIEIPNHKTIKIDFNLEEELNLNPLELFAVLKMEKSSINILNSDKLTYKTNEEIKLDNFNFVIKDEKGLVKIVSYEELDDESIEVDFSKLEEAIKEFRDKKSIQTYITLEKEDFEKLYIPITLISDDVEINSLDKNSNIELVKESLKVEDKKAIVTTILDVKNIDDIKELELEFLTKSKEVKILDVIKSNGYDSEDISLITHVFRDKDNFDIYKDLTAKEIAKKIKDLEIENPIDFSSSLQAGYKYIITLEIEGKLNEDLIAKVFTLKPVSDDKLEYEKEEIKIVEKDSLLLNDNKPADNKENKPDDKPADKTEADKSTSDKTILNEKPETNIIDVDYKLNRNPSILTLDEKEAGLQLLDMDDFDAPQALGRGEKSLDGKKFTIRTRFDVSVAGGSIEPTQYFYINLDDKLTVKSDTKLEDIVHNGKTIATPIYESENNRIKYTISQTITEDLQIPLTINVDFKDNLEEADKYSIKNSISGLGVVGTVSLPETVVDKDGNVINTITEPGGDNVSGAIIEDSGQEYSVYMDAKGDPVIENYETKAINWTVKFTGTVDFNTLGLVANATLVKGSGLGEIKDVKLNGQSVTLTDNAIKGKLGIVDSKHFVLNQLTKELTFTFTTPITQVQSSYMIDLSAMLKNKDNKTGAVRFFFDKGFTDGQINVATPNRVGMNNRTTILGEFTSSSTAKWTVTDGVSSKDTVDGLPLATRNLTGDQTLQTNGVKTATYGLDSEGKMVLITGTEKTLNQIPEKGNQPQGTQAVGNIAVYEINTNIADSDPGYSLSGVTINKNTDINIQQRWTMPDDQNMPSQQIVVKNGDTKLKTFDIPAGTDNEKYREFTLYNVPTWEIQSDGTYKRIDHKLEQILPNSDNFTYEENINFKRAHEDFYNIHNTMRAKSNDKLANFTIVKVDETDNTKKLEGATFKLLSSNTSIDTEIQTNEKGEAEFKNIRQGSYTLIETHAPAGYKLDTQQRTIVVDNNGTVTVQGADTVDDSQGNNARIEISNKAFDSENVGVTKVSFKEGVSLKDSTEYLEGAEFTLSTLDGKIISNKVTDNQGKVDFGKLDEGKYILEETNVPEGYEDSRLIFDVTVGKDGRVSYSARYKVGVGTPIHGVEYYIENIESSQGSNPQISNITQRWTLQEGYPGQTGTKPGVWEAFNYETLLYTAKFKFTDAQPGMSFEIQFDHNLDFKRSVYNIPQIKTASGQVIAEPYMNYDTNILTYVFNQNIAQHAIVEAEINIQGIRPDIYTVRDAGTYTFQTIIDPSNTQGTISGDYTKDGNLEQRSVADGKIHEVKIPVDYLNYNTSTTIPEYRHIYKDHYIKDGKHYIVALTYYNPKTTTRTQARTIYFDWISANQPLSTGNPSAIGLPAFELRKVGVYKVLPEMYNGNLTKEHLMPLSNGVQPDSDPNTYKPVYVKDNIDSSYSDKQNDIQVTYDTTKIKSSGEVNANGPLTVSLPKISKDNEGYVIEETFEITDLDKYFNSWRVFHLDTRTAAKVTYSAGGGKTAAFGDQTEIEVPVFYTQRLKLVNNKYIPGKFSIIKLNEADREEKLKGAEFSLTDSNGNAIYRTTGIDGRIDFTGIKPGEYTLIETKAPEGFTKSDKIWKVTVTSTGSVNIVETGQDSTGQTFAGDNNNPITLTITNKPAGGEFVVYKRNEDQQPLPGAKFQLSTLDGTIIETVISNDKGIIKFEHLRDGTFILEEIEAPEGYNKLDKKWVVVVKDGKSKVYEYVEPDSATNPNDNPNVPDKEVTVLGSHISDDSLYVVNETRLYEFKIKKIKERDPLNPNDIPDTISGATFKLSGPQEGQSIDHYERSFENGIVHFKDLPAGTYILSEDTPPPGYERLNTTWTVKILKNGEVWIKDNNPESGAGFRSITSGELYENDSGEINEIAKENTLRSLFNQTVSNSNYLRASSLELLDIFNEQFRRQARAGVWEDIDPDLSDITKLTENKTGSNMQIKLLAINKTDKKVRVRILMGVGNNKRAIIDIARSDGTKLNPTDVVMNRFATVGDLSTIDNIVDVDDIDHENPIATMVNNQFQPDGVRFLSKRNIAANKFVLEVEVPYENKVVGLIANGQHDKLNIVSDSINMRYESEVYINCYYYDYIDEVISTEKFTEEIRYDDTKYEDYNEIETIGVDGKTVQRYKIKRRLSDNSIIQGYKIAEGNPVETDPITQIRVIGTKPRLPEQDTWTSDPVELTIDIPFKTIRKRNNKLKDTEIKTTQEGIKGQEKWSYSITYTKIAGQSAKMPADWPKDAPQPEYGIIPEIEAKLSRSSESNVRVSSYNRSLVEVISSPKEEVIEYGPNAEMPEDESLESQGFILLSDSIVEIENKKIGLDLRLTKVNSRQELLEGAEFKVVKKTDDTFNTDDTSFTPITATSDKDGKIIFKDVDGNVIYLEEGFYTLEETNAPTGYYKSPSIWKIQITERQDDGRVVALVYGPEETTTEFLNRKNVKYKKGSSTSQEYTESDNAQSDDSIKYSSRVTYIDTHNGLLKQRIYIDTRNYTGGPVNVQITPVDKREEYDEPGKSPVTTNQGVKTRYRTTYRVLLDGTDKLSDEKINEILIDYDISRDDVSIINTAKYRPFDWGFDEDQINLVSKYQNKDAVYIIEVECLYDPNIIEAGNIDLKIDFYNEARFEEKQANGEWLSSILDDKGNIVRKPSYFDGNANQGLVDGQGNPTQAGLESGGKYQKWLSMDNGRIVILDGNEYKPINQVTPISTVYTRIDINPLYTSQEPQEMPKEGVEIRNEEESYSITFVKLGKTHEGMTEEELANSRLEGAVFKLQQLHDGVHWTDVHGSYVASSFNGIIGFRGLKPGRYRLVEVEAPAGYMPITEPILEMLVEYVPPKEEDDGTITPGKGKITIKYDESSSIFENDPATSPDVDGNVVDFVTSATSKSMGTIKNEKYGNVKFVKIDKEDGEVLENAEFELYYKANENDEYQAVKELNNQGQETGETVKVTSDENGLFSFTVDKDGYYALKETKAPDGYVKPNGYVREFKVEKEKIFLKVESQDQAKKAKSQNEYLETRILETKPESTGSDGVTKPASFKSYLIFNPESKVIELYNTKNYLQFILQDSWTLDTSNLKVALLQEGKTIDELQEADFNEITEEMKVTGYGDSTYDIKKILDGLNADTEIVEEQDKYKTKATLIFKIDGMLKDLAKFPVTISSTITDGKDEHGIVKNLDKLAFFLNPDLIKDGGPYYIQYHSEWQSLDKIENFKANYPETGGVGSIIFTIAGLSLMAIAFIEYRRKKVIINE